MTLSEMLEEVKKKPELDKLIADYPPVKAPATAGTIFKIRLNHPDDKTFGQIADKLYKGMPISTDEQAFLDVDREMLT